MATGIAVPTAQPARFGSELRRLYENIESDDAWRDIRPRSDVGAAARRLRAAVTEIDDDEPFRPTVPGDDLLVIPDRAVVSVMPVEPVTPPVEAPLAVVVAEIEVVRSAAVAAPVTIVVAETQGPDRSVDAAAESVAPVTQRRRAQRPTALLERLLSRARCTDRIDGAPGRDRDEPVATWEIRVAPCNPLG
ncbi:MAG: hypothetical protein MUF83_12460 [Acidimicrobiales bacterium]|jgi:hypothetical protein|nr:hypothetical protein [Acidimicrobiales bacterium]